MRNFSLRLVITTSVSLALATLSLAAPSSQVTYSPAVNIVQGNQPLSSSYVLSITAPTTLVAGNTVNLSLGLSVLSKPAIGVSDAQALGFISVSPSTLTFTGPNQVRTVTVAVNVPLGNFAGDYAYKILPSGWPVVSGGIVDAGATVNARVSPPASTDISPPALTLLTPADGTVYTYQPATGIPVTVPVNFTASVGATGSPVGTMQAAITAGNQTLPISVTTGALPSFAASANGSVQLTAGGNYTVTVLAANGNGTSYASSHISVNVVAPPPTITVASPGNNATFSYALGGAGASVPVSVTATGIYGNITSLAATLDGAPVALNTSGVNGSSTASGSATLIVGATGSHTLVFSAANAFGSATPVTVPFTVAGTFPAPTVTILTPANGSTFTRAAGDPATVVNYSFQGGTSFGTITSAVVTLDGTPVATTPTLIGLNTANVSGTGSLSFSAGGSHTLNVKLTNNGGAMASTASSFIVNQTQPQICEDLTWLPPISLNKTIKGGSTMPIKFTLECCNKFVRDTSVLIAIYEVFQNGTHSTPVVYPYGEGSPNPPDYAITGKQYHLNFATAKGTHSYQIEVYSSASGTVQLLGTKELNTKGKKGGGSDPDHDDDYQGDCDDHDGDQ